MEPESLRRSETTELDPILSQMNPIHSQYLKTGHKSILLRSLSSVSI